MRPFFVGFAFGAWIMGQCWILATMPHDGWFAVMIAAVAMQVLGLTVSVAARCAG